MTQQKKQTVVRCGFDGGLHMPKTCIACDTAVTDKNIEYTGKNKLGTSKIIIKFPVCDECFQADRQYVDVKPITIVGIIILLLSIFSISHRPENYPPTLFLIGGIIWMGIVVGYVAWTNIRGKKQNSVEIINRRNKLKNAVDLKKMTLPRRNTVGEITLAFTSSVFANDFKKLNKGEIIE